MNDTVADRAISKSLLLLGLCALAFAGPVLLCSFPTYSLARYIAGDPIAREYMPVGQTMLDFLKIFLSAFITALIAWLCPVIVTFRLLRAHISSPLSLSIVSSAIALTTLFVVSEFFKAESVGDVVLPVLVIIGSALAGYYIGKHPTILTEV